MTVTPRRSGLPLPNCGAATIWAAVRSPDVTRPTIGDNVCRDEPAHLRARRATGRPERSRDAHPRAALGDARWRPEHAGPTGAVRQSDAQAPQTDDAAASTRARPALFRVARLPHRPRRRPQRFRTRAASNTLVLGCPDRHRSTAARSRTHSDRGHATGSLVRLCPDREPIQPVTPIRSTADA